MPLTREGWPNCCYPSLTLISSSRPGIAGIYVGEDIINTAHEVIDPEAIVRSAPRLADGLELIGEYRDSGFQEPHYIVRRADGQIIQLPRLMYVLAASLDGNRDL